MVVGETLQDYAKSLGCSAASRPWPDDRWGITVEVVIGDDKVVATGELRIALGSGPDDDAWLAADRRRAIVGFYDDSQESCDAALESGKAKIDALIDWVEKQYLAKVGSRTLA